MGTQTDDILNLGPAGQQIVNAWMQESNTKQGESYIDLREEVLKSSYHALKEELEEDELRARMSEIQKNVDLLGSTLAVSKKAREDSQEFVLEEPLEVRGWSVFSHIYDVHGQETFHHWPRVYDSDKYFPAVNGVEGFLKGITHNFTESSNADNHEGDKYTAHLDVYAGEDEEPFDSLLNEDEQEAYEFDLMVPATEEDSEYSHAEEDVERIHYTDDLSLLVPSVTELIRHKGTIERDNGDGDDPFREKDGNELLTLLHVAEQKGYEIDDLEEEYSEQEKQLIGSRVREAAPKVHSELGATFTPEDEDYVRAVTNWADISY